MTGPKIEDRVKWSWQNPSRPVSKRAIYYREEAGKCLWHAENVMDAEIREELRKLAARYIMRAVVIEGKQPHYVARSRPP